VILTAVVSLVGIANLTRVHWQKVQKGEAGNVYSAVLLIFLFLTIVITGFFGPNSDWSLWIFNYVEVPIESSLMAVLAVVLAYASARMLKRRLTFFSLIFVATVLLVLLGTVSIPGIQIPMLRDLRNWFTNVLAVAGARGILIGVGLGTVATGLRILIGADRPYGG
jgi:hypothetical protein